MARAALVDPYLEVRELAHERARRARVVEVDMRQQQRARLLVAERVEQRVGGRLRPGIDDDVVDLPGADDVLETLMEDVDRAHRRFTLAS